MKTFFRGIGERGMVLLSALAILSLLVIVGIVLALFYLRIFNYRTLLQRPLIER